MQRKIMYAQLDALSVDLIKRNFTGNNFVELGKAYGKSPLAIFLLLKMCKHKLLKGIK